MAHSSLEQVNQDVPLNVEWRAFELQPEEVRGSIDPAAMAEKRKQIEAIWPQLKKIAEEQYGLKINPGLFGVDTRLAHIGAKVAKEHGKDDEYHRKVFEAHWVEQKNIGDTQVLAEIAASVGIDPKHFKERLKDEELRAEVLGEELSAQQTGIRGVPAMIIDNRYLLSGAQPKGKLIRLFEEYRQRGALGPR